MVEKTATLTHKVRNPQNINQWLDIWNATVTSEYNDENDEQLISRKTIISPTKEWEIPVKQIVPSIIRSQNTETDTLAYPIYYKEEEGNYVRSTEENYPCNNLEELENSNNYYFKNEDGYVSINSDSVSDWNKRTETRMVLDDDDSTVQQFYIILSQDDTSEKEEYLYNAVVQTNNQTLPKNQIAVFSEEGYLIPLSSLSDDSSSESGSGSEDESEENKKRKFLTENNEWQYTDEYQLNSEYVYRKEELTPIINFFNEKKDDNNRINSAAIDEFGENWGEYFEEVQDNDTTYYILRSDIESAYNSPAKIDVNLSSINRNDQNNLIIENKGSFSLIEGNNIKLTSKNIEEDNNIYEISSNMPRFSFDEEEGKYQAGYLGDLPGSNAANLTFGLNSDGVPGWYTIKQLNGEGTYQASYTDTDLWTYDKNNSRLNLFSGSILTSATLEKIEEQGVVVGYELQQFFHYFDVDSAGKLAFIDQENMTNIKDTKILTSVSIILKEENTTP